MMNPELEIAVQRLVDNELTKQQLAEFLRQAEADPQLWRMATLAFVEDRVWSSVANQRSIQHSAKNQQALSTADSRSSIPGFVNDGAGTVNAVEAESMPRVGPENIKMNPSSRSHRRSRWPRYVTQMMLTAALVLLALNVALQFNPVRRSTPIVAAPSPTTPSPDGTLADKGAGTQPLDSAGSNQTHLVSNEPYQLQLGESTVPLHRRQPNEMLQAIREQSAPDPLFNQRMLDFGYQVQPDVRYISGKSLDGRSFIVPIQSYRVRRSVQ